MQFSSQNRFRFFLLASVLPAAISIAVLVPDSAVSQAEEAPPSIDVTQAPATSPSPVKRKPIPKKPEVVVKKSSTEVVKTVGSVSQPAAEPQGSAVPSSSTNSTGQAAVGSLPLTEPAQHANAARIQRCGPLIAETTRANIKTAHTALSSWSTKQPDEHMFQSIVGLNFASTVAPKAAAILVAAPEASGCETTFVQIHPTARSCGEIESELRKGGLNPVQLAGLPLTQSGTERKLLIPVPGAGCVVVGVGLTITP